jgi:flagellar biosynthesis protein FlhG
MAAEKNPARRIAVISGKGGVGKSIITANLAGALSASGRKILVLDADLGLANLDIILGVAPQFTIFDVLHGTHPLEEVLIPTTKGFDLIPGGSSVPEGTLFTQSLAEKIESVLSSLENRYDAILFDAGTGIGDVVLFFANLAHEILLVVTPEPTSVMDAYATIKILSHTYGRCEFLLLVNQVNPECSDQAGERIAGHLRTVISKYLKSDHPVRLELVGSIPTDPMVHHAVRQQKLLAESCPEAPAACFLNHLARLLNARLSL